MSTKAAAGPLLHVSRETLKRLERFSSLVEKWNRAINLVSGRSLPDVWARHIEDSAQIYALRPKGVRTWADLGSGGGFPGVVVAIMALEDAPDLTVHLVESDQRKATFLREAVREAGARAVVHAERIEHCAPLQAEVISARALAPLAVLCSHLDRHGLPGGLALLQKGAQHEGEIAEAKRIWDFDVDIHPSLTDSTGVVLAVTKLKRK